MTSTIKVNNIKDTGDNNMVVKCGSTLTLGKSGDTVAIASGASTSGMGRTGTVDWQTTPKTGDFTAANGEGYFVNTTSGAVTMTMPSGSAGAIVSIQDYNKTFDNNNLTVTPASGEKINGGIADGNLIISTEGQGLTFVYVDSTVGWKTVHENEFTAGGSSFVSASGGNTVSTSGNCRIHTFTGPGTFTVSQVAACAANNVVSYLIVAGGGGSGGNRYHIQGGGGGGAGGFREAKSPVTPYTASPLDGYPSSPNRITVTAQAYPIVVGGGGSAGGTGGGSVPEGSNATSGGNSSFGGITSAGGGFGGQPSAQGPAQQPGQPGGSGGGGGGGSPQRPGGTGNTPPTSPAQGSNGGAGSVCNQTLGGSGGGATGAGSTSPGCSPPPSSPSRGTGATTSITGSPVAYSTGGSFSSYNPSGADPSCAGADNTGNGGDASNAGPGPTTPSSCLPKYSGKGGGSGIVIIRYKYQ